MNLAQAALDLYDRHKQQYLYSPPPSYIKTVIHRLNTIKELQKTLLQPNYFSDLNITLARGALHTEIINRDGAEHLEEKIETTNPETSHTPADS